MSIFSKWFHKIGWGNILTMVVGYGWSAIADIITAVAASGLTGDAARKEAQRRIRDARDALIEAGIHKFVFESDHLLNIAIELALAWVKSQAGGVGGSGLP